jgi:hypothetical protein
MRTRDSRPTLLVASALAALLASLCCLTPLVLVLFGLASVSTAVSLDNLLSGRYVWWFRLAGLAFLAIALLIYFRRRGVCTLDEARRQRNRILNFSLIALFFATGGYLLVNGVILAYWGAAVGLPWELERSATPVSAALLAVAAILLIRSLRPRGP